MMRTKAFAAFGVLAMLATAGCNGDRAPLAPQTSTPAATPAAAVSPDRTPRFDLKPAGIGQGTTLLRRVPLASDVTVSATIGPRGGTLDIPRAGLRVIVPPGAVQREMAITATALAGDIVAYEFGPHGTRFALPLIVTQATAGTNADSLPPGTILQLGYFNGADALDRQNKRARIAELISSLALVTRDAVVFPVWHFSGYTVIWGFHRDGDRDDG